MARRLPLRLDVGERLLTSKLQILTGAGNRRPSAALSILTGRIDGAAGLPQPVAIQTDRMHHKYAARTVYLSEANLHDIDHIIDAWQRLEPHHITRSAVLRRAVEHLRVAVEADPAKSLSVLEQK